jgi:hypothetical protein
MVLFVPCIWSTLDLLFLLNIMMRSSLARSRKKESGLQDVEVDNFAINVWNSINI